MKTIRSVVALADNTVVLVIGAEPGAPFEVTPVWTVGLVPSEVLRAYIQPANVRLSERATRGRP